MKKIFSTIFLLAVCVYASSSAPRYRSLRVLGMGNAFIAVADNKDAIYYNPAGLNLLGTFGDFKNNPDMGYMPKNGFDWRILNISYEYPGTTMGDVMDLCGSKGFWRPFHGLFIPNIFNIENINACPEIWDRVRGNNGYDKMTRDGFLDSLEKFNEYLSENSRQFDRKPINAGVQVSFFELAVHNFGLAIWSNIFINPYLDHGIVFPFAGYYPVTVDIVVQTALAFSPVDKWSTGIGLKAVKRAFMPEFEFHALEYKEGLDTLRERGKDFADVFMPENFLKFNRYDYAMDFGVLHQLNREVRLGASLRDVFFGKLAGESITPNLSMGVAYTPMLLQSNSWWDRKVNLAMDYVDVLDGTIGSMFFSHLNIGVEAEQNLLPSPTRDMAFLPRLLFGALGGVTGFFIGSYVGDKLIGDINDVSVGSYIGMAVGAISLSSFGFGGDLLRISVGGGFEGGYWAATGAFKTPFFAIRVSSFAEEMGVRTGQSGNRHYMLQFGMDF